MLETIDRLLVAVLAVAACGGSAAMLGEPGRETGPCLDYQCLGGELVCLSNLCVDPNATPENTGDDSGSPSDDDDGTDTAVERTREVDILFVIDNSGSMGDEQGRLVESIGAFIDALEDADAEWRIGVTTSDVGNPWCGSTSPESGTLVLTSCRGRTGQFVFNGNPPQDATSVACLDQCSIDTLTAPNPWIERVGSATNLDQDVGAAEALRCILPQGIAGCGFEQQLEAMHRALRRAEDPAEDQFGFLRPTAMLVVILMTDEVDCSYLEPSIFLTEADGGNPSVFWSDPDASAPSSAVCWNAGVVCTGGPGTYDECHSENKGENGEIGVGDDDGVLRPMIRYTSILEEMEESRKALIPDRDVLFSLIAGVQPDGDVVYADSDDPIEQGDFGIGAGCTYEDPDADVPLQTARPPVRERELAEAFGIDGARNLHSICVASLEPTFLEIADTITQRLGP